MRWRWGALVALFALSACGSSGAPSLSALSGKKIILVADFTPPQPPPTPSIIASLQFASGPSCPDLPVEATLDGVALSSAPNATGNLGSACQIGFVLTGTPPPARQQSVLTLVDAEEELSAAIGHLLDSRAIVSSAAVGAITAGDQISFQWSTGSDQILTADAYFGAGNIQQQALTSISGTTISLTVPTLAANTWNLQLSVLAAPNIVSCPDATACDVEVFDQTQLTVNVQ